MLGAAGVGSSRLRVSPRLLRSPAPRPPCCPGLPGLRLREAGGSSPATWQFAGKSCPKTLCYLGHAGFHTRPNGLPSLPPRCSPLRGAGCGGASARCPALGALRAPGTTLGRWGHHEQSLKVFRCPEGGCSGLFPGPCTQRQEAAAARPAPWSASLVPPRLRRPGSCFPVPPVAACHDAAWLPCAQPAEELPWLSGRDALP